MAKTSKELKERLKDLDPAVQAQFTNEAEVDEQFETLISGADFYNFKEDGVVYIGYYTGQKSIREADKLDGKGNVIAKAGDIMGYIFDNGKGEEVIIGNSHQVEKAMTEFAVQKGDKLRFEFLGETQNAAGQPVNRFKIQKAIRKTAQE